MTIRRIFWDGADDYIQLYWVDKGLSLEFTPFDTLAHYVYRAERREQLRRRQARKLAAHLGARAGGAKQGNHAENAVHRTSPTGQRERPGKAGPTLSASSTHPAPKSRPGERTGARPSALAVGIRLNSKQKS